MYIHVITLYMCSYSVRDNTYDGISALRVVVQFVVVMCVWPHHRSLRSLKNVNYKYTYSLMRSAPTLSQMLCTWSLYILWSILYGREWAGVPIVCLPIYNIIFPIYTWYHSIPQCMCLCWYNVCTPEYLTELREGSNLYFPAYTHVHIIHAYICALKHLTMGLLYREMLKQKISGKNWNWYNRKSWLVQCSLPIMLVMPV